MRGAPEEDPEFQIAPMIDILLVLLVFFMSIASTEVLQVNQELRLPVAKDAAPSGPTKGQAIVNVLWNELSGGGVGTIEVDGQQKFAQASDLVPYLTGRVADVPDMRILLRADKSVRYEFLRSLLKAIGDAGIGNVTFSVVDKEQTPAPAAK